MEEGLNPSLQHFERGGILVPEYEKKIHILGWTKIRTGEVLIQYFLEACTIISKRILRNQKAVLIQPKCPTVSDAYFNNISNVASTPLCSRALYSVSNETNKRVACTDVIPHRLWRIPGKNWPIEHRLLLTNKSYNCPYA